MPRRGEAVLKIQYPFQKEGGDLADKSEIFRYLCSTVPALAHNFSSRLKLALPIYWKTVSCHGRSFDVTSDRTYGGGAQAEQKLPLSRTASPRGPCSQAATHAIIL